MDIFNLKKIEKLQAELERLKDIEQKLNDCEYHLRRAESEIKYLLMVKSNIPEDCISGDYCRACEFGKEYVYHRRSFYGACNHTHTGYICKKADACKNFTQKEVEK